MDEEHWWDEAKKQNVIVDDIQDETEWVEKARAIWPDYYHTIGPDGKEVLLNLQKAEENINAILKKEAAAADNHLFLHCVLLHHLDHQPSRLGSCMGAPFLSHQH